ncbi:MAG: hypothetical protein IJP26_04675 [Clostridia bacterium]|nr:hypothetical protein [Clostridia bacterium]
MNNKTKTFWPATAYVIMFIIMYFLTYTSVLPLKIGNSAPMPLIAGVVAVAFFYGEWLGFTAGLITGIFADAVAANTVCFNMVTLMLIGVAVGLLVNKYLNKNIYSALLLAAVSAMAYFFVHWLIFNAASGGNVITHFLLYYFPSAIYSALFIFPAYLPGRYLK